MPHPALQSLRARGPKWLPWNKTRGRRLLLQSRELLYERLFSNALPGLGITSRYFPLKSAANYSLLYLILRTVTELPIRRVLELGCGQSTLLLDDLACVRDLQIVTLEHNPEWAARMQARVRHRIHCFPLVSRAIRGVPTSTYDTSMQVFAAPQDLVIVDGPVGIATHSRWGVLEYLEALVGTDFVVIFDDVERAGEQQTIAAALDLWDSKGITYAVAFTRALKSQCVIAAGAFAEARYY